MLLGCVKGDKMLKNDTIPLSLKSRIHSARQKSRVFFFFLFFWGVWGGSLLPFCQMVTCTERMQWTILCGRWKVGSVNRIYNVFCITIYLEAYLVKYHATPGECLVLFRLIEKSINSYFWYIIFHQACARCSLKNSSIYLLSLTG